MPTAACGPRSWAARSSARFTVNGLDRTLALPVANPTDVTFGGPDLDRLYVTSIAGAAGDDSLDGALLVIDGLGVPRSARARGHPALTARTRSWNSARPCSCRGLNRPVS